MKKLTIRQPDDWHLHLRDGDVLQAVASQSSHFARAIIMPNLVPPVVTTKDAIAYRQRIKQALPQDSSFTPLMTLYLTEQTSADDVEAGFRDGIISAVKLYPAGATTNSHSGVHNVENVYPVLERMASIGLPMCVHGEVTDPDVDIFDREAVFIERVLAPLRSRIPNLRIIMEHVTTSDGVEFVRAQNGTMAGTITTHHLIINRNAMLVGGMHPHYYCLPVAKREKHRLALLSAATSGDSSFFLGTDSAPHIDPLKESACGCAGVFNAPNTMACLAHVFEEADALSNLEAFTSLNGPAFYKMPVNESYLSLIRHDEPVTMPKKVRVGQDEITVFDPQFPLHWSVQTDA